MTFTRSTHVVLLISSIMDLLPLGTDVIKDDFGGKLPSGRPDVRARPRLPLRHGFTRRWVFTIRGRGKNRVRADAGVRPREKIKIKNKKINFFFGSCCRFRFSIPKIPKLPELRGLRGRSREKKKVFSA
jgi:hypothetical protein